MTNTTRDLIQQLAETLAEEYGVQREFDGGEPLLGSGAIELLSRARAFLDQPEPEGPTDEELHDLWLELYGFHPDGPTSGDVAVIARAILARWGRPAVEPVPVSERPILKSSNFNDANGHCWCGTRASIDKTGDFPVEMLPSWELREPCAQDDCVLPHHALPAPTTITTETP